MSALRVGFLFNHFFGHQVPHAAPIAFELSRFAPEYEVVLLCSTRVELNLARKIGNQFPKHRAKIKRIRKTFFSDFKKKRPSKKTMLRENLSLLSSFDGLVVPERNSAQLVQRYGVEGVSLIHTRHGAGDRAGSYDERLRLFDLILVPGEKSRRWLLENEEVEAERIEVVGYPKFDAFSTKRPPTLFQGNGPTVIYNPHFESDVSSWYRYGVDILRFFAKNPQWNLIFAPHIELSRKGCPDESLVESLPPDVLGAPNIHIDTESSKLSDMTYTREADVYLGDASSQVYEFIAEPRPCIFVDAHETDWRDSPYHCHWEMGDVIKVIDGGLREALEQADQRHGDRYAKVQALKFEDAFLSSRPGESSQRAASAIDRFLKRREKRVESLEDEPI